MGVPQTVCTLRWPWALGRVRSEGLRSHRARLATFGAGAAKAKGKRERASEGTDSAKEAQDDRTTATGATTYPRDAEGWKALAGGHAE